MKSIKLFWLLSSTLATIAIFFLMEKFSPSVPKFIFAIPFALLFFLITFFLGQVLFKEKLDDDPSTLQTSLPRVRGVLPVHLIYALFAIASLVVIFAGQPQVNITNDSMFKLYESLNPVAILKLVSGLALLSILPGYAVCRSFFKNESFVWVEKFGLSIAISFCISLLFGLAFVILGLGLSSLGVIISLWIFVTVVEVLGRFYRIEIKKPIIKTSTAETILLLLTLIVVLVGSYSITLAVEPVSGIAGGDIADYFTTANRFVYLHYIDTYVGFKFYLFLSSALTGLPQAFVYPALQFMILLVPISVYFLMKGLFRQSKVAVIGALFVSVMQGLSSVAFLIKYGSIVGGFGKFVSEFEAGNTSTYALWVSTIESGLFIFAIAFIFKYVVSEKRRLNYLFVGALLMVGALYSHFLFLFLCFIATIMIFSVLRSVLKMRLLEVAGAILLFIIPFEFLTRMPMLNVLQTFSIEYTFSANYIKGQSVMTYVLIVVSTLIIYLALLFRHEIADRFHFSRKIRININPRIKSIKVYSIGLFLVGLGLVILAIFISQSNFGLQIPNANMNLDSYVKYPQYWILYYSLGLPLVLGGMFLFSKHYDKQSLTLLGSLLLSVFGLAFLFLLTGPTAWATPSLLTKRYLFFAAVPLGCFAALGLVTLFTALKQEAPSLQFNPTSKINGRRFSLQRLKSKKLFGFLLSFFLIVSIAASFLSYVYIEEYWIKPVAGATPMESSDAVVLSWMADNLSRTDTVMALSPMSYNWLCGIVGSKVVPLFLEIQPPIGDIWPRRIIIESQVPEVISYGLNKLGINYIFVSSEEAKYMENKNNSADSTFSTLLKNFIPVFSNYTSKVLKIPENHLLEDLPIPSQLFEAFTGSTLEPWYNRELLNNLLLENTTLSGRVITVKSESIYFNCSSLPIDSLQINGHDGTFLISSATLYDLELIGVGRLDAKVATVSIDNSPTGYYSDINITGSEITLGVQNCGLKYRLNSQPNQQQIYNFSNVTITLKVIPFEEITLILVLRQPTFEVNGNGNLISTLQGAFLFEDTFFRKFSRSSEIISGNYTLDILYTSGIIFSKIEIHSLEH